ncbi:hypothetical protein ACGFYZ_40750 [Streptomyces sp. NPDC048330]|uniref:hypothetical protein n=1 Tax=Streptomyces sp. NPDC048330 TaxID=3365533 RepID=UPI00371A580F
MTTHSLTQEPTESEKVTAMAIAILSGTVAALAAYMITRHLGSTPLVGVGCSGVSFGAVLGIVKRIEEKPGLLKPPALRPRQHLVGAPTHVWCAAGAGRCSPGHRRSPAVG